VTKYIKDRDTLVLAVAPAMTPRLTSNQGIGLVIDTGKQAKTVIALTMTDLVQRENLKAHVVDRLLRRTDELQDHRFGGVVAVINRLHTDTEILADAAEREAAWFCAMLAGTPEDYKPHMQAISSAVTVSSVIRHLDELYDRHIREDWQPRALKVIDAKINQQKAEIAKLGTPPEALHVEDLVKEALSHLAYEKVEATAAKVVASALQGLLGVTLSPVLPLTASIKGEIDRVEFRLEQIEDSSRAQSVESFNRAFPALAAPGVKKVFWVEQALARRAAAAEAVKGLVQGGALGRVLGTLRDAVCRPMEEDRMPLRIRRFTSLRAKLHRTISEYWAAEAVPKIKSTALRRLEEVTLPYAELDIIKLRGELEVVILTAVVETVHALPNSMTEDGGKLLAEETSHALQRHKLSSRLEALHRYRTRLENIGEALERTASEPN
jgi:hypothetical protein